MPAGHAKTTLPRGIHRGCENYKNALTKPKNFCRHSNNYGRLHGYCVVKLKAVLIHDVGSVAGIAKPWAAAQEANKTNKRETKMNNDISEYDDDFDMWADGADESRARAEMAIRNRDCNEFSNYVMRQIDDEADQQQLSTVVGVYESDVPYVDAAVEGLEDAGYSVDWDAKSRRLLISWESGS